MFQTHYAKIRPKKRYEDDRGEMLTQLESVLYSVAPNDTLFTKDVLIHKYVREQKKHPGEYKEYTKAYKELDSIVNDLVQKGYLKEIHGSRLDRFVHTF